MSLSPPDLILASTSTYRRQLLAKLQLPFTVARPDFKEIPLPDEAPQAMALRFAAGKALAVATDPSHAGAHSLVVGSDQVVVVNGQLLGKPGTLDNARLQLRQCSGQWVTYTSSLCLARRDKVLSCETEDYSVLFRPLKDAEIDRYLALDQPLDCAGSIKAEGLGITLLARCRGDDINTLYGLPLLRLAQRLREHQLDPLSGH